VRALVLDVYKQQTKGKVWKTINFHLEVSSLPIFTSSPVYLQRQLNRIGLKGLPDVPTVWQRRRNGPLQHPKVSDGDIPWKIIGKDGGSYQNYIGPQERKWKTSGGGGGGKIYWDLTECGRTDIWSTHKQMHTSHQHLQTCSIITALFGAKN
jgi:hypothetical protein